MNELIIQYREHSKSAIRQYESKFNDDTHMSLRRSKDIVAIKEILNRSWKEVNECISAIKAYLENLETGWWIFQTGNSHLKDNLTKVVQSYEDPIAQSLMQYSTLIQSKLEEALSCVAKMDKSKSPSDLFDEKTHQIQLLKETLKQQKKEMEILVQKNHELSRKVTECKRETLNEPTCLSSQKGKDDELKSFATSKF
jgi:hypothetical protein